MRLHIQIASLPPRAAPTLNRRLAPVRALASYATSRIGCILACTGVEYHASVAPGGGKTDGLAAGDGPAKALNREREKVSVEQYISHFMPLSHAP